MEHVKNVVEKLHVKFKPKTGNFKVQGARKIKKKIGRERKKREKQEGRKREGQVSTKEPREAALAKILKGRVTVSLEVRSQMEEKMKND